MPEWRLAAPGDDRATLVEFWARNCDACAVFDRDYVSAAPVQRALASVRHIRYDVDSFDGSAAYERLIGRPISGMSTTGWVAWSHHVPVFVGIVDGRVVERRFGLPPPEMLAAFIAEVGALGGNEGVLRAMIERGPDDVELLARAGRWYQVRRHPLQALDYWQRVAALADASPALRAEADWQIGRAERKGRRRDAHALLVFAADHAGTKWAYAALAVASVLKELAPVDVASALRANARVAATDPRQLDELVYVALAAHQNDLALELAQQLVRLTKSSSAAAFDALGEVYYYRYQANVAVAMAERAVALAPDAARFRADLDRFRRADGTPGELVEAVRFFGLDWLSRFYGDED